MCSCFLTPNFWFGQTNQTVIHWLDDCNAELLFNSCEPEKEWNG